jgi:hypothetical protein
VSRLHHDPRSPGGRGLGLKPACVSHAFAPRPGGRNGLSHRSIWAIVEGIGTVDTAPVQTDKTALLTRELVVARRRLEGDTPHSPAWAATIEWVDDLERTIRELDHRSDRRRLA